MRDKKEIHAKDSFPIQMSSPQLDECTKVPNNIADSAFNDIQLATEEVYTRILGIYITDSSLGLLLCICQHSFRLFIDHDIEIIALRSMFV